MVCPARPMGLIFAGVHADITHRALTHARLGVSANHAPGRRDLTLYCGRRGRDVSTGTNANRKNRRFRPASEAGPIRAETTPRAHGGVRPPPIVSESQRLEMGAERVIEENRRRNLCAQTRAVPRVSRIVSRQTQSPPTTPERARGDGASLRLVHDECATIR